MLARHLASKFNSKCMLVGAVPQNFHASGWLQKQKNDSKLNLKLSQMFSCPKMMAEI